MTQGTTPQADPRLRIFDEGLADAATRSGTHLVCRRGCTACCHGVFAISAADAKRLREGLAELTRENPSHAARLQGRTSDTVHRLAPDFPGDPQTGLLPDLADPAFADIAACFEDFANDEPCPVLDPETGACDLYAHRPLLCRSFGPPMPTPEGLGHCELCFTTARPEEVLTAAVPPEVTEVWREIDDAFDREHGSGPTIVAFALQVR